MGPKGRVSRGRGPGLEAGRDLGRPRIVGGAVSRCGMEQGPVRRRAAGRRESLLTPGRVSLRRKGLRGFPFPRVRLSAGPNRRQAAAGSAPSGPVGGEGGGVRWCPSPAPGSSSPQSSPPTALPLSRLVPPSPPLLPRPPPPAAALAAASYAPEPPGRRGWAWGPPGLCLHAPRRPDVPSPRGAFASVSRVCLCPAPGGPSCHW